MPDDVSQIARWRGLAKRKGLQHGVPCDLVLALIAQESGGNPYAIRVEEGFFTRYLPGLRRLVSHTASRRDDHWFQYRQVFACSYGLMQVLYPVALERGLELRYPTELCDPDLGTEAGCRHLRYLAGRIIARDGRPHLNVWADMEATRTALLLYNGGGNQTYPARVLAWRDRLAGRQAA